MTHNEKNYVSFSEELDHSFVRLDGVDAAHGAWEPFMEA
jgi:hypothetical protein